MLPCTESRETLSLWTMPKYKKLSTPQDPKSHRRPQPDPSNKPIEPNYSLNKPEDKPKSIERKDNKEKTRNYVTSKSTKPCPKLKGKSRRRDSYSEK